MDDPQDDPQAAIVALLEIVARGPAKAPTGVPEEKLAKLDPAARQLLGFSQYLMTLGDAVAQALGATRRADEEVRPRLLEKIDKDITALQQSIDLFITDHVELGAAFTGRVDELHARIKELGQITVARAALDSMEPPSGGA
jgi:hypothetical protein